MRTLVTVGFALFLVTPSVRSIAGDEPPRWIEAPTPGGDFQLTRFLQSRGYTKCPAGANAPAGSVRVWGKAGSIAHSSVVVCPDQQIEMGHKPGGSKYVSELLPPKQNPKPGQGEYELLETWQPPAGAVVDLTRLDKMVGVDREYDNAKTHWNCHGFSAHVVHACVSKKDAMPDDKWVIWYAERIGYQPVYVTTFARYKKEEASANYPGGGIDPKVKLEKTFVGGPYGTLEEATQAACDRMSNFRRLSGIYAGLPVADMLGRPHNIQYIRVDPKYWEQAKKP